MGSLTSKIFKNTVHHELFLPLKYHDAFWPKITLQSLKILYRGSVIDKFKNLQPLRCVCNCEGKKKGPSKFCNWSPGWKSQLGVKKSHTIRQKNLHTEKGLVHFIMSKPKFTPQEVSCPLHQKQTQSPNNLLQSLTFFRGFEKHHPRKKSILHKQKSISISIFCPFYIFQSLRLWLQFWLTFFLMSVAGIYLRSIKLQFNWNICQEGRAKSNRRCTGVELVKPPYWFSTPTFFSLSSFEIFM